MTIDTSGKWWVGSEPQDVRDFLEAYAEDGYSINDFRLAKCTCGSISFKLEADDNEGVARRTCATCGESHFICDSEKFWSDAQPELWECVECGCEHANVGIGFSLYDEDPTGIRWLYVGERCSQCGVLGCFADWKIAMSDVLHLMDKV